MRDQFLRFFYRHEDPSSRRRVRGLQPLFSIFLKAYDPSSKESKAKPMHLMAAITLIHSRHNAPMLQLFPTPCQTIASRAFGPDHARADASRVLGSANFHAALSFSREMHPLLA